jgi:restriction system protein
MPLPTYEMCMLPLLRILQDGNEHRLRDVIEAAANHFGLTTEDREQLLPSGNQRVFDNRMGWARTYLKKAGLLEYPKRGLSQITARGKEVLAENPDSIDAKYLQRFPEFKPFRDGSDLVPLDVSISPPPAPPNTPAEAIENAYVQLSAVLADELLESVQKSSPARFERIVIDLLVKMGYGGSAADAARVIGKSGDEGIDGIINEDRLGLDRIYIQAKRWQGVVGRPEIQKFAGALAGKHATKGIFITTSSFTVEAEQYVQSLPLKIVLIGGKTLSSLMIEQNVGVTPSNQYTIKKVDFDYFAED